MDNIIHRVDGTILTKNEMKIRELEQAIRMTEIVMRDGKHPDMDMYLKAIENYKRQIKELEDGEV